MRLGHYTFILALLIFAGIIPWISTAVPKVPLSTYIINEKNPVNKLLESTFTCFEKCKKDSYYSSTLPAQSKCILECSLQNPDYQHYSCDNCRLILCEGLRPDVKPICINDCEDYNINCEDPTKDCNACLNDCMKYNDGGACFQKCEQTLCGDTTCFQCKLRQPGLYNSQKNPKWNIFCGQIFSDCEPLSKDCDKCLSLCKDIQDTDKQENCVMNCGGTNDCKLKDSESCQKCLVNCQGFLPSVQSDCVSNCGVRHLNCKLPDQTKCDDCWEKCKLKPGEAAQSKCVDECQGIKECSNSNCLECQDRASGLLPDVYELWVQKCRDIYKSNCPSISGLVCDQCWSDCFTKYAQSKDVSSLDSCIGKCQKTLSCQDSTCNECKIRVDVALKDGKIPYDWWISMDEKCISFYPECSGPKSACGQCAYECKDSPDCMAKKCGDCVSGWDEKCINCETFCSKQTNPASCLEFCRIKNQESHCQNSDCIHCKDSCSILSDPEQRSWCNALCLMNEDNNCSSSCSECWDSCPPIPIQPWGYELGCQTGCTRSVCGTVTCEECETMCKTHTYLYSYDACVKEVCGSGTPPICEKVASLKVSSSNTPSQSNQNETVPVTPLINLMGTKKYQVTVTWPEVSKLPTTIIPATRNQVTPVLGWTVNTGDKAGNWGSVTTSSINQFPTIGSGRSNVGTGNSFTGTGRVVSGSLSTQDTGSSRSVTGSGNPLSGGPLFFGNTSNVNITTNATVKINS